MTWHQRIRPGLSSLGFQTVTLETGWMTQEVGGMTVLKLQEKPLTRRHDLAGVLADQWQ